MKRPKICVSKLPRETWCWTGIWRYLSTWAGEWAGEGRRDRGAIMSMDMLSDRAGVHAGQNNYAISRCDFAARDLTALARRLSSIPGAGDERLMLRLSNRLR